MNLISSAKVYLKSHLTPSQLKFIKYIKPFVFKVMSPIISKNLVGLASLYGTDKWEGHWYAQHYQKHFYSLRLRKLNILEIGVGGYDNPQQGGESLKMWKTFFPHSTIYGVDIYNKKFLEEDRIKIFQGSQDDKEFLENLVELSGGFDIIIDDGSHLNEHVIKTFNILFPLLNNGGIYVVEDTQTSYWRNYGGDSDDLNNSKTMMTMFKNLIDCLNYQEFDKPGYIPSYFDRHIIALHFYHNLVFIYKGDNNESGGLPGRDESATALREFEVSL